MGKGQSAAKTYKCMRLIGKTINNIKVVDFVMKDSQSRTYMLVECQRCGYGSVMRSDHLSNPKAKLSTCSHCRQDYAKEKIKERALSPERKALHLKYQSYKSNAKTRNLRFNLTLEEFESITKENCHYCGDSEVGVDRINNREGYVENNVVPCCTTCNMMKKDLEYDAFLAHVSKVQRLVERRTSQAIGDGKGKSPKGL